MNAIRRWLRARIPCSSRLADAYADAWAEWEEFGEGELWESVAPDGLVLDPEAI